MAKTIPTESEIRTVLGNDAIRLGAYSSPDNEFIRGFLSARAMTLWGGEIDTSGVLHDAPNVIRIINEIMRAIGKLDTHDDPTDGLLEVTLEEIGDDLL